MRKVVFSSFDVKKNTIVTLCFSLMFFCVCVNLVFKLRMSSSVDLNDPVVKANIPTQISS